MNIRIKKTGAIVATAIALVSATGIGLANAQQTPGGSNSPATPAATAPANGPQGRQNGRIGLMNATVCSTTNYDDVASQALGITSPALRQALVGGQTMAQIATSKNVSIQVVTTALKTAYEADLTQAVSDGLMTQQVADQIKTLLDNPPGNAAPAAPSANATPGATQQAAPNGQNPPSINPPGLPPNGPQGQAPGQLPGQDNRQPGFGFGFGFGPRGNVLDRLVSRFNTVNEFQVAAKAIGVSCADLVKAVQGGQTVAQVATGKNVQAKTVIDALTAAEKAAIAQDVTEGLIGQAQADGETANIATRAAAFVNNAGGRRGPDGFGFGGFGQGDPNGQNPKGGKNGNGNTQPSTPAPATAAGTSS